jgi:RND superfamily putative drug exporter
LREEIPAIAADDPVLAATSIYIGGVSPVLNDVRHNLNRDLQVMALVVMAGLFVVLLFVLGSVLIPVRAILTILLSISWTLALTIVLFHTWMAVDIIFILPLALFVMAMGLGMDYDIFIITRVREEVAKGKPDSEAIAEATTRTGGIISACGIVMAGAFFTLMLSASPLLKEIGFALAFAILLDSMVVRIYLVPAIMVLAGKYNWWAPGRLQRVRREETPKEAATDADDP